MCEFDRIASEVKISESSSSRSNYMIYGLIFSNRIELNKNSNLIMNFISFTLFIVYRLVNLRQQQQQQI